MDRHHSGGSLSKDFFSVSADFAACPPSKAGAGVSIRSPFWAALPALFGWSFVSLFSDCRSHTARSPLYCFTTSFTLWYFPKKLTTFNPMQYVNLRGKKRTFSQTPRNIPPVFPRSRMSSFKSKRSFSNQKTILPCCPCRWLTTQGSVLEKYAT